MSYNHNEAILDATQENEIFKAAEQAKAEGNQSLVNELHQRIVVANLRLAAKICRSRTNTREFEELMSDASLALMQAVQTFDHSKGFRFSTLAHRCITNLLQKENTKQWSQTNRFVANSEVAETATSHRKTEHEMVTAAVEAKDQIETLLGTLNERDQDIIKARFGIGCEPKTLIEIANEYGSGKQRVHQLQTKILNNLKKIAE